MVVDDDARNIFALTTVLENQGMDVMTATNGRQAIELIHTAPELSVVLMDIMMPEMDGYTTIREIRKQPKFRSMPILALTAKAMKGIVKSAWKPARPITLRSRLTPSNCCRCCVCGCTGKDVDRQP